MSRQLLTANATRWFGMALLLVAETEVVVVRHAEVRRGLRALFHLPLYHILLGFLTFCGLIWLLARQGLPRLDSRPIHWGYLGVHFLIFVAVNPTVTPLWHLTQQFQAVTPVWFLLFGLYLASWLAAVLPVSQWLPTLRAHGPWMVWALFAGSVCTWLAEASELLWEPLVHATFWLTQRLLGLWFDDVVARPDDLVLGTSQFQVRILHGCSGYEGIALMAMFSVTYLWLRRRELQFPQAFWMLPISIAIIWLSNAIRLVVLIALGQVAPGAAFIGFHSQAGWMAFTVVGVVLILLAERERWFRPASEVAMPVAQEYPAAAFIVPLLVFLFARMMAKAISPDLDWLYPFCLIPPVLACTLWRSRYGSLFSASWGACAIGLVAWGLWISLPHTAEGVAPSPFETQPFWEALLWTVGRVAGAVLVVPVIEELAFRGYLMRLGQGRLFEEVPLAAVGFVPLVLSSLLFGLLHARWLAGMVTGVLYGLAARRRGRLADAVVAHGTTNLCLALQVLAFHQWSLWL